MRQATDLELKRVRDVMELAHVTAKTLRATLGETITDESMPTAEFTDICTLESAALELVNRFSHLWEGL